MDTKRAADYKAAFAKAEYWFGRGCFAGLDVYLRLYGREVGRYLDANNYKEHIEGLYSYICKDMDLQQEQEAAEMRAALRFILLGEF